MPHPLISIIIPTYNVEFYIADCLASVYTGLNLKIEVIVVDNNSIDNTLEILKQLQTKYNFTLLKELKQGAPATRNKGLSVAKGEWVQFLDSDDLLLPGKLSHQVKVIQNYDLIVGSYIRRSTNGLDTIVTVGEDDPWYDLFITKLGITSSNLWRTSILHALGGFSEEMGSSQEYDLIFRYLQLTDKVHYDNNPLTIVRDRETGSITSGNKEKQWKENIKLRNKMLIYFKTKQIGFYKKRENDLKAFFVRTLHSLYIYDPNQATEYYHKVLGENYKISKNSKGPNRYKFLYNMLGFSLLGRINFFRWLIAKYFMAN